MSLSLWVPQAGNPPEEALTAGEGGDGASDFRGKARAGPAHRGRGAEAAPTCAPGGRRQAHGTDTDQKLGAATGA